MDFVEKDRTNVFTKLCKWQLVVYDVIENPTLFLKREDWNLELIETTFLSPGKV